MSSARHDLVLMIQLQKVYDRIAEAINEWNSPPVEVQELHEANRRRQVELENSEGEVARMEEESRGVLTKEQEWTLELEHFQRQKGLVTNEREFTAVISEIDYATKALQESVARREELETAIADLTEDIKVRRKARPDEEDAQQQVVKVWDERRVALKKQIHDEASESKVLEADLQPKVRARFLRLLESKRGTAIAEVVDGSCSLCHFALRPHLQQRVRRIDEIIACEHCHRILFFAEVNDEEVE